MPSARRMSPRARVGRSLFVCVAVSLLLPTWPDAARADAAVDRKLSREYSLRQGAVRGLILQPSRQLDLQSVEAFLGVPFAAPPVGSLRFMPPVSAPPWRGVKMATAFGPVCPQALPPFRRGNPPSLGRQHYMARLQTFLRHESEDCLHLNIYVPYREQKSKKFPILVFIHGDSFEWSTGNAYDGKVLASYGNIMVITVNFRLGILGFMKPSLTEHEYGNNGLLDQLAALQWIKDNIEDLNGDPKAVTLMGHGTGAASVNFLMLSPISNGLFHRAILMSGSAESDWALTKTPAQFTSQVAQGLGCNPAKRDLMACLQAKPLSEIKKVQLVARDFESPLGPVVAGSFVPSEPSRTMQSFPDLLSKYQVLLGVTEHERFHEFGAIELDHGVLENQRDEFIARYLQLLYPGAHKEVLADILQRYGPSKGDPRTWSVDANRDLVLDLFSDARTLAPLVGLANYHSGSNRHSYFYVFAHNSVSTDYAPLNKSVHGEELPYVLGAPFSGPNSNSHFHSEYTQQEKLLSEVVMRLWTNFVKLGTPNTQSKNEYYTGDIKLWNQYNVEWPEYNVEHQTYLRLDIPPRVSSFYRSNFTNYWLEVMPKKMKKYAIDPLLEINPYLATSKPKPTHRNAGSMRTWNPPTIENPHSAAPAYGRLRPYSPPAVRPDSDLIYREIQSIKTPIRPLPPNIMEKPLIHSTTTNKPQLSLANDPTKTSSGTVTLIITLTVLFLVVNIFICSVLYIKKRKRKIPETNDGNHRPARAEIGEVDLIGRKCSKGEAKTLKNLKNSCSMIKSIRIDKIRKNSKKTKNISTEPCKTPKSDDSGGFRERFQLRRHLSTSTIDAHTKVKEWITNEVMHRCSPNVLRKSSSNIVDIKIAKPFTRSEELLPESKFKTQHMELKPNENLQQRKNHSNINQNKTSEKTTSTSALGSHSSINSTQQSSSSLKQIDKSTESLKSKSSGSTKPRKKSVAIDATPAIRTQSILNQRPIELSKSLDLIDEKHSKVVKDLHIQKFDNQTDKLIVTQAVNSAINKTYTNEVKLSVTTNLPLKNSHKHSTSDPVTGANYLKHKTETDVSGNILPPIKFRNDINVTSKDENVEVKSFSPADALLTIQRRNFPKVLPDLPSSRKRLSLQPASLQSFKNCSLSSENQSERLKVPPLPPPRTTTLDRRLAYKNSKPMSSFDTTKLKHVDESDFDSNKNYENVENFQSLPNQTKILNDLSVDSLQTFRSTDREFPKYIIASSDNIPSSNQPKILIKQSASQISIPTNTARVRLPDNFHSQSDSITSMSSFCSDDDTLDDEIDDNDINEDKLIQELVGSVESEDVLDSKGPDTMYEKKLEIIPVRINTGMKCPNTENYVCVSNLLLPDLNDFDKTAQIKPKFGFHKLQNRSESINRPPEKAVRIKQKKKINPSALLSKSFKSGINKKDTVKLEHSNSGSSNDTETSTGTVKKVK